MARGFQGSNEVRLGPVQVPDGVLMLRSPRAGDAAAWSAARLASREWLEPAFPAWGDDWAAEQSETAWVQRWWRLTRAARRGLAKPFVILLDGALIGEIGIDAVDPVSGAGEASVWMTRSHGSADVMGAASLLLIGESFTDDHPVDLLLSPVATTSRKGRSPGLTAAGLRIEGTFPRRVGAKGLVDHDMWVIRNTPADVARTRKLLTHFPVVDAAAETGTRPPVAAIGRAAVRGARAGLGELVRRAARRGAPDDATRPIVCDGVELGTVRVRADAGTGVAEMIASLDTSVAPDADVRPGVSAALSAALAAVRGGRYGAPMHPAVRVPNRADGALPDADLLTALGLELVATFEGNPEGPRRWSGEQRWEPARV